MSDPFVGVVITTIFNYAPEGWLPCDGRTLSVRDYQMLFAVIGTTYGGDGINTFGLPDLRGRTTVGQGTGAGLTPRALGQKGGAETVTLTASQMAAHTHTATAVKNASQSVPAATLTWGGDPATPLFSNGTPDAPMNTHAISVTGGGAAHNNMSPFMALNYIICVQGLYPTRE